MRESRALIAAMGVLCALPAAGQEVAGAKTWIGHQAEIEDYLRTAAIVRVVDVGEGVTDPKRAFFAPGGLVESAILKDLPPRLTKGYWESYKSEIAAYELDRLLGLDMVPVTVERRYEGNLVSVQQWLPGCSLLRDQGDAVPRHPREWARQVCRQRIFDALVANIDRNAGNILVDKDFNLILIDHSRAFARDETPFLEEISQADQKIFGALKALDQEALDRRVKPWLFNEGSVRALLHRRDRIVERLERLLDERGEAAVFPF